MKLKRWVVFPVIIVALLAACSVPSPAATSPPTEVAATEDLPTPETTEAPATEPAKDTIVFGDIGSDPAEIIDGTQPIADYVASKLADYGVAAGAVRVAASDTEMIELIKNGEVDLYFDSVYPATLIADGSGARPFVRRWSRGVGEYHTVIFASKASGIASVDDLPGKMVAFDNPYSTSGYMLPLAYLSEQGFTLTEKQSNSDAVAKDEIGYAYSNADENTVQWVISGLVAAGVTDNVRYARLDQAVRDQLVILAETEDVPRQVGLARADIDPKLLKAITEILLKADQDDEGKAALESFANTTKLDEFPDIDKTFVRIREMIDLVNKAQKP